MQLMISIEITMQTFTEQFMHLQKRQLNYMKIQETRLQILLMLKNRNEIIFVRGTTEAINLVAYAWGRDQC